MYKKGIFLDKDCNGNLNHSVAVVGYNLRNEIPYILIKNSWGKKWGDKGFVKIALGDVTKKS